ncbi:MAG: hypothetical protein LBB41_07520 [Prevotellaceae bacterium]|jgi:hypothetical protein|nr:hypothetical protein [Prevotellaceae bacterium]
MQHKRKRPEYPLYYWTMDGWDAELYYQETKIDKNGHSITTYNNRATIVIVLDASINYPIGYAIGRRENGELIKEAMKNAVNHTAQLFGKRYSPQQLQSDRFGVKGIASLAGSGYTKWYTPAKAGNAKSKVVEPYNKYLNNTYCRLFPNWSGYGVKTSNERQPNAELVNMNKKAFPDFEGLVKQLEQCITFERGKKLEQYLQLFSAMPQEQHLPMSAEKYLLMFGQYSSERQLRGGNNGKIEMKGNGLILTIGTKKYTYDCFDVEFRRNMFVQWDVVYDVDDMSRAVAVNEDGTRRFMLEEKYVQPMARVESSHGDMTQFDRVNQYNDQLKEHIIDFHAKMESSVNKIGAPQLIESLFAGGDGDQFTTATESDKLLITDSTGSHKNNKYAERLAVTRHEAEKQAAKEIRKQQKSFADERREYLRQKVNLLEYL